MERHFFNIVIHLFSFFDRLCCINNNTVINAIANSCIGMAIVVEQTCNWSNVRASGTALPIQWTGHYAWVVVAWVVSMIPYLENKPFHLHCTQVI